MEINHALDKSNVRSALFFASNYLRRPFQLFSKHLLEHLQNKHFEFVMNVQIATFPDNVKNMSISSIGKLPLAELPA